MRINKRIVVGVISTMFALLLGCNGSSLDTPNISAQPVSTKVTAGQTAHFSARVVSNPSPSYQWQRLLADTWTDLPGATSASYVTPAVTAVDDGAQFRCVASNAVGTATSSIATLIVQSIAISTMPANFAIVEGQTAIFAVEATGTPELSYQWFKKNSGANSFTAIPGATSARYTTPLATRSDNGTLYYCQISASLLVQDTTYCILWVQAPNPPVTRYSDLIKYLLSQGYTFMDFTTFWNSDKTTLPDRLIVLRHDIHYNDTNSAYSINAVEKDLLGGAGHATYYVMLNDVLDQKSVNYATIKGAYLNLIDFLKQDGTDIQPHVSPIDMYQQHVNPPWANLGLSQLMAEYTGNYQVDNSANGITYQITGADVLNLIGINTKSPDFLKAYNTQWTADTGLTVMSYSAHGSGTPMNQVFNNAQLLNQKLWLKMNFYAFDAYNSSIHQTLNYISDVDAPNSKARPAWMTNPQLIAPGRYQILIHPTNWTD
jgi:hypothetical protein